MRGNFNHSHRVRWLVGASGKFAANGWPGYWQFGCEQCRIGLILTLYGPGASQPLASEDQHKTTMTWGGWQWVEVCLPGWRAKYHCEISCFFITPRSGSACFFFQTASLDKEITFIRLRLLNGDFQWRGHYTEYSKMCITWSTASMTYRKVNSIWRRNLVEITITSTVYVVLWIAIS